MPGALTRALSARRAASAARITAVAFAAFALLALPLPGRAAETNGFAVKFTGADNRTDFMVLPNLWLYVEATKPATPFVPPGKFTAVFEGSISAELRSDYIFKVEELNGTIQLEANGAVVLDASKAGTLTKAVQLNKGANQVRATFTAPTKGDAFVRIGWTENGTNSGPIPNALITHAASAELKNAQVAHLGRELFLEHRCVKCHTADSSAGIPELAMDAPALDGIGARRRPEWLTKWILDPQLARTSVYMPKMFRGATARDDAAAVAAYLATLEGESEPRAPSPPAVDLNPKATREIAQRSGANAKWASDGEPAEAIRELKPIFERFHCSGCHTTGGTADPDPAKIQLQHVGEKFSPGSLVEFLKEPERHFAWTRMPNFKLAVVEAKELAEFLLKEADPAAAPAALPDKAIVARGEKLVQTAGCLNCHDAKLPNRYGAPTLAKVAAEPRGCLAEQHTEAAKAPDFGFNKNAREALLAFLRSDRASLQRHSPMEFAARQTRLLQCNSCHGQIDLVPPMEGMGGKLKPEWTGQFLGGEPFKVRADRHPNGELWVEARMPAFRSRAKPLAEGMAMEHGYPPRTPPEGPVDEKAATIGLQMIGKNNGLSCVSCHAVNDLPAREVFESEGLNLGLAGARLLKPFFFRWMRNPLAIDPQTKMPAYFEDGRSALTEYYDGDAEEQINAMYEYIRLGARMAKPNLGE